MKVGRVKVEKPIINYLEFTPKDPELDDQQYGHLVEIYDFDSAMKTADIAKIFVPTMSVRLLFSHPSIIAASSL